MTFGTTLGHFHPKGVVDLAASPARGRGQLLKVRCPPPWGQSCSPSLAKLPGMRRKGLGCRPLAVVPASVARAITRDVLGLQLDSTGASSMDAQMKEPFPRGTGDPGVWF